MLLAFGGKERGDDFGIQLYEGSDGVQYEVTSTTDIIYEMMHR